MPFASGAWRSETCTPYYMQLVCLLTLGSLCWGPSGNVCLDTHDLQNWRQRRNWWILEIWEICCEFACMSFASDLAPFRLKSCTRPAEPYHKSRVGSFVDGLVATKQGMGIPLEKSLSPRSPLEAGICFGLYYVFMLYLLYNPMLYLMILWIFNSISVLCWSFLMKITSKYIAIIQPNTQQCICSGLSHRSEWGRHKHPAHVDSCNFQYVLISISICWKSVYQEALWKEKLSSSIIFVIFMNRHHVRSMMFVRVHSAHHTCINT